MLTLSMSGGSLVTLVYPRGRRPVVRPRSGSRSPAATDWSSSTTFAPFPTRRDGRTRREKARRSTRDTRRRRRRSSRRSGPADRPRSRTRISSRSRARRSARGAPSRAAVSRRFDPARTPSSRRCDGSGRRSPATASSDARARCAAPQRPRSRGRGSSRSREAFRRPRCAPFDHPDGVGWTFAGARAVDRRERRARVGPRSADGCSSATTPAYGEVVRALAEDGDAEAGAPLAGCDRRRRRIPTCARAASSRSSRHGRTASSRPRRSLVRDAAGSTPRSSSTCEATTSSPTRRRLHRVGHAFGGRAARAWADRGRRAGSRRAMREQVLADGVHYERSPVYQGLVLEHLLVALETAASAGVAPPAGGRGTRHGASRVALAELVLPDGSSCAAATAPPGSRSPDERAARLGRACARPRCPPRASGRACSPPRGSAILEDAPRRSAIALVACVALPAGSARPRTRRRAVVRDRARRSARRRLRRDLAATARRRSATRIVVPGAFAGVRLDGRAPADPYGRVPGRRAGLGAPPGPLGRGRRHVASRRTRTDSIARGDPVDPSPGGRARRRRGGRRRRVDGARRRGDATSPGPSRQGSPSTLDGTSVAARGRIDGVGGRGAGGRHGRRRRASRPGRFAPGARRRRPRGGALESRARPRVRPALRPRPRAGPRAGRSSSRGPRARRRPCRATRPSGARVAGFHVPVGRAPVRRLCDRARLAVLPARDRRSAGPHARDGAGLRAARASRHGADRVPQPPDGRRPAALAGSPRGRRARARRSACCAAGCSRRATGARCGARWRTSTCALSSFVAGTRGRRRRRRLRRHVAAALHRARGARCSRASTDGPSCSTCAISGPTRSSTSGSRRRGASSRAFRRHRAPALPRRRPRRAGDRGVLDAHRRGGRRPATRRTVIRNGVDLVALRRRRPIRVARQARARRSRVGSSCSTSARTAWRRASTRSCPPRRARAATSRSSSSARAPRRSASSRPRAPRVATSASSTASPASSVRVDLRRSRRLSRLAAADAADGDVPAEQGLRGVRRGSPGRRRRGGRGEGAARGGPGRGRRAAGRRRRRSRRRSRGSPPTPRRRARSGQAARARAEARVRPGRRSRARYLDVLGPRRRGALAAAGGAREPARPRRPAPRASRDGASSRALAPRRATASRRSCGASSDSPSLAAPASVVASGDLEDPKTLARGARAASTRSSTSRASASATRRASSTRRARRASGAASSSGRRRCARRCPRRRRRSASRPSASCSRAASARRCCARR